MSRTTRPFFIVSSGRSGTQMFEKLLGSLDEVEMHHEYCCTHIQAVAAKYSMGLMGKDAVREAIESLHVPAVLLSDKALWGDSSNKLSWVIPVLDECFDSARFIHLVRDGRKVVSSFFNKLGGEIYDDRSVAALYRYVDDPSRYPCPPPEKKYWWKLPVADTEADGRFRGYDQFKRICYHWAEVNRVILRDLEGVDRERKLSIRLEDLTNDPAILDRVLGFLGIDRLDGGSDTALFETLKRPHNVHRPENHPLTPEQTMAFMEIAWPVMETFGYDKTEEYEVIY